MEVDVQVAAAPKNVPAQKVLLSRVPKGALQDSCACDKLPANVDISELHVIGPAGEDHAFQKLVGVFVDDLAVLESARLGFVRIANQVNRLAALAVHERPLQPAGKTRAAAAAQPGLEHLVSNLFLGRHFL